MRYVNSLEGEIENLYIFRPILFFSGIHSIDPSF